MRVYERLEYELSSASLNYIDEKIDEIINTLDDAVTGSVFDIVTNITFVSGKLEALHHLELIDDDDYQVYIKRLNESLHHFKAKAFAKKGLFGFKN